jgi:hypothetical protein
MSEITLLKEADGLELWTGVEDDKRHLAVKTGGRRARVLATLAEAEAYFAAALRRIKSLRAQ